MNFKGFMLSGIDKVNVEIGLIAVVHNLKKYSLLNVKIAFEFCNGKFYNNYSKINKITKKKIA